MEMLSFKNLHKREDVIYSFEGNISQRLIINIEDILKKKFEELKISTTTFISIFSILTEQSHNIMSYSKDKVLSGDNKYESKGTLFVGYNKSIKSYYIGSSNLISFEDSKNLVNKLELVNSLDSEGLKKEYKEVRRSRKYKHSRGAGLGFLEMAKRSSSKINYKIDKIENDIYSFKIITYIEE